MTEYALYKGDKLLHIGTAEEIAQRQGIAESTVVFYASNVHRRRLESRGALDGNVMIAIKLEGDDEDI